MHFHLANIARNKIGGLIAVSLNGQEWYKVPEKYQLPEKNVELYKIDKILKAAENCTKSNEFIRVKLNVPSKVYYFYLDEDDDFVIGDDYLAECLVDLRPATNKTSTGEEANLKKLIEMLAIQNKSKEKIDLKEIQDEMMIKKYDRKSNAEQWINGYEVECKRLNITCETTQIEFLKVFLEDDLVDWYDANSIKLNKTSWSTWKDAFIKVYGSKGWSDIVHAFSYKFISGSLIAYANAKERKLLESDSTLTEQFRIYQIVVGLPNEVREKLDREKTNSINALLSRLAEIDDTYQKKKMKYEDKNDYSRTIKSKMINERYNSNKKVTDKVPCSICSHYGFNDRYHPMIKCLNLERFLNENKKKNFKKAEVNLNKIDTDYLQSLLEETNKNKESTSAESSDYSTDTSCNEDNHQKN